jgi:hypothetical protein
MIETTTRSSTIVKPRCRRERAIGFACMAGSFAGKGAVRGGVPRIMRSSGGGEDRVTAGNRKND